MNTVVVDGLSYTKAKEVSRKYHYTTDYLGQLCRAGKIDCQLVGRAWYINEASVGEHKSSNEHENRSNEISSNDNTISPSIQLVRPSLSKHTIKQAPTTFLQKLAVKTAPRSASQYEVDESDLNPKTAGKPGINKAEEEVISTNKEINQPEVIRRITPIIPQDLPPAPPAVQSHSTSHDSLDETPLPAVKGTRIPINNNTKRQKIAFTRPPVIPLKGKLSVQTFSEPKLVSDDEADDLDTTDTHHRTEARTLESEAQGSVSRLAHFSKRAPAVSALPPQKHAIMPVKHSTPAPVQFLPKTATSATARYRTVPKFVIPLFLLVSVGFLLVSTFAKTEVVITSDDSRTRTLFEMPF